MPADSRLESKPVKMSAASKVRPDGLLGPILALGLGALVRLLPVTVHGFPLNDGGLFYRMTQDLVENGFRIPLETSYNGGGIPFAYPPLAFFLAGGLHVAGKLPLLEVMRWMPALVSILTIPAFYLLARRLLPSKELATIAVLVFALIPRSFEWLVMGGGIARAPGFLFAILSLHQGVRLIERRSWRDVVLVGVLLTLTTLSHLEMAWFAIFSLALLWAFSGTRRSSLGVLALSLALAAVLSGVWWVPALRNLGLAPFLSAVRTGGHTWATAAAMLTDFSGEPYLGIYTVMGILGALVCLARRQWLLPTWLFTTILLDPRAAGTDACVPLAMLVAVAVVVMVVPPLVDSDRHVMLAVETSVASPKADPTASGRTRALVVAGLVTYGLLSALSAPVVPTTSIRVLRAGEAQAMDWIDNHLPPSGKFLVVSGRTHWASDPLSEWFPALTDQVSVATPQGREWLGDLTEAAKRHLALQQCASRGLACLEARVAEDEIDFDQVLVATYPEASAVQTVALVEGLRRSPAYELVFANDAVEIYAHHPAK